MHYLAPLVAALPFVAAGPIALPRRSAQGCSEASFKDFQWTIENFDFHASYIFTTPAHQNSWGYVNFTLANPALLYKAECSASSNQLSDFFFGLYPYNCSFPENVTYPVPTFDYSRPSGLLRINQTWSCDDADPKYPTTFTARGAVNLTLDCTDSTYTNPNWTTPGDIYSDREVKCQPATLPLKPFEMYAIA